MLNIKWAGSEDSFHALVESRKRCDLMMADPKIQKRAQEWEDEQDDDMEQHWMVQMEQDSQFAIINIKGALCMGTAGWWGMYSGEECGYDDIRNAIATAINNGATEILCNIQSPGGTVYGIGACTDFIKEAQSYANIQFFTDTYCASGGVWLSTSTGNFKASPSAEVGSVGVIGVTTDMVGMFDQMGIKRRVFKSTPLKGVGNPNEHLSDAGAKEIQRGVDESNTRFIDHIAQGMGLTSDFVRTNIATGQMWYAEDAMQRGLIKGITTFDALIVDLQNKVSQNSTNKGAANLPGYQTDKSFKATLEADMSSKRTIKTPKNAEDVAALAAAGILPEQEAKDEITDPADPDLAPASEASAEETKVETPVATSETSVLAGMLATANEALLNAKVELNGANAAKSALEAKLATIEGPLKELVVQAIQHRQVYAGGAPSTKESLMAMDPSVLVAMHAEQEVVLSQRFGNGGQRSVVVDDSDSEETQKAEKAAKLIESITAPLARISDPNKKRK